MLDTITQKLEIALQPSYLNVTDESHHHKGHIGYRAGQVTHVRIEIVSERFEGLIRLEQQRLVHTILVDEIPQIHALTIKILSHLPDKAESAKG